MDDVGLPKATIVKLVKDYMPSDVRIASETTEMLVACCTEFVQLVSSEANTVAEQENKKTIQPEHVLSALKQLGFPDYCGEVTATWDAFKEECKASSSQKAALRKTGADQAGLTQAEQIALQQQMVAAARAASMTTADSAAMVAAAYQAKLAAAQQQQQQQQQQAQGQQAQAHAQASGPQANQQGVQQAQQGPAQSPAQPQPPPQQPQQQLGSPSALPAPQQQGIDEAVPMETDDKAGS